MMQVVSNDTLAGRWREKAYEMCEEGRRQIASLSSKVEAPSLCRVLLDDDRRPVVPVDVTLRQGEKGFKWLGEPDPKMHDLFVRTVPLKKEDPDGEAESPFSMVLGKILPDHSAEINQIVTSPVGDSWVAKPDIPVLNALLREFIRVGQSIGVTLFRFRPDSNYPHPSSVREMLLDEGFRLRDKGLGLKVNESGEEAQKPLAS